MQGTVKAVRLERGFGFIVVEAMERDVFFHVSDLRDLEFDEQLVQRRVQFELTSTGGGGGAAPAPRA